MNVITSTRVLIIEDDNAIAALVQRTLADARIITDVASTGLDGLWMARERRYGAICLDILMPGMNGYEVCRTLRSESDHTPILMLTAKTGEYDETDGFDMGADAVVGGDAECVAGVVVEPGQDFGVAVAGEGDVGHVGLPGVVGEFGDEPDE